MRAAPSASIPRMISASPTVAAPTARCILRRSGTSEHETIAVPRRAARSRVSRPACAVRRRAPRAAAAPAERADRLSRRWCGSAARSGAHGDLALDARAFSLTAPHDAACASSTKIPLNRSYFDASSARYLRRASGHGARHAHAGRRLRGAHVWPEDFRLRAPPPRASLRDGARPRHRCANGCARSRAAARRSPYAAWTAWRKRAPPEDLEWPHGAGVHGQRRAGRRRRGAWRALRDRHRPRRRRRLDRRLAGQQLLHARLESEKGIIAAPLPLDNYLGDLNSGQAWYRPSYMLVAVLADERAAALVQSALGRVYNQFYRHQLVYYHPTQNCTSISVDTLRALGWDVPARGPSSRALAWRAFRSSRRRRCRSRRPSSPSTTCMTDQTRLLPAAALEEIFADLLGARRGRGTDGSPAAARADARAGSRRARFLRFPQFPSSRAFGDAPAVTTWEYQDARAERSCAGADRPGAAAPVSRTPARPRPAAARRGTRPTLPRGYG